MLKLISVTTPAKPTKKNVQFSSEVDFQEVARQNLQNYDTVINLLCETTSYLLEEKSKATLMIENIICTIERFFEKSSATYNQLMAKCYIKKAMLLPIGEDRENFIKLANNLDPTDEKYFRR